ncbi:hypothetical protein J31TS4_36060 [Paenibacillus sp. J31TS4]|uniref:GNAT family N-acetyltransferase n=1 Tax=Paenibacillus sp. J31TS4 TaxID=2807195 RepID=UPI001B0A354C|nr:GNAT family N-acetyltransferase [Paenibacillus sp. J31TS4]GIP40326.1 hypothetical protein J31TS4_36060 [Paenibacillus sp. J31TS4]
MKATIRKAEAGDREQLASLLLAYIVGFYGCEPPADRDLALLQDRLAEGSIGCQFVAEREGTLVGFATLYGSYSTLRARPVAVLNDLYVAEEERGRGLGQGLFEACAAYAAEQGYASMSWETDRENTAAQRFYDRMGGRAGSWLVYSLELDGR